MTKHTPGPWELEAGRSFVTKGGTFHLAYGYDKHGNPNFRNFVELDRNARLISAAPDLLAALESFSSLLPSNEGLGGHAPMAAFIAIGHKARAAIAKAKGE